MCFMNNCWSTSSLLLLEETQISPARVGAALLTFLGSDPSFFSSILWDFLFILSLFASPLLPWWFLDFSLCISSLFSPPWLSVGWLSSSVLLYSYSQWFLLFLYEVFSVFIHSAFRCHFWLLELRCIISSLNQAFHHGRPCLLCLHLQVTKLSSSFLVVFGSWSGLSTWLHTIPMSSCDENFPAPCSIKCASICCVFTTVTMTLFFGLLAILLA